MAAFFQVNCTYCAEEINGVRVQCCECVDFDICLQCFSSGAEISSHKNDHSYRLIEPCAGGVFGGRDNWTGQEELQLLEAMDLCSFGSWEHVSKLIETRTPEEVKEKYMSRYFDGRIGRATWSEIGDCRPVLIDHTSPDKGPLAPEITSRLPPIDATPEEAAQVGYVAHRDDFEREYDIEAERLVFMLQLKMNEDTEMEIALKLAQVDMYTRRLRERNRRKRHVRDYQLVAKFNAEEKNKDQPSDLTTDQKEFRYKMRVYSQFFTSGEHQRLIENIEKERELRHRLAELLKYRSLGLTTQDEIVHYEQHAAFQQEQHVHHRKTGSSGFRSIEEHHSENGNGEANRSSIDERSALLHVDAPASSSNCSCSQLDSSKLPPITTLPKAYLLSHTELQFCTILCLLPAHYRTLKCSIILDNINSNGKRRKLDESVCNGNELKLKINEPPTIKDVITEYLRVCGWLPTCPVD
ncbi:transcriptional adapter 2B isoform X2 [Atheta coriaria]|uniref:transcriptional adapter 2B isoform X2 n=1 Tax=Dalotia coriaria TaxID=877792 RepID=UPI0031F42255